MTCDRWEFPLNRPSTWQGHNLLVMLRLCRCEFSNRITKRSLPTQLMVIEVTSNLRLEGRHNAVIGRELNQGQRLTEWKEWCAFTWTRVNRASLGRSFILHSKPSFNQTDDTRFEDFVCFPTNESKHLNNVWWNLNHANYSVVHDKLLHPPCFRKLDRINGFQEAPHSLPPFPLCCLIYSPSSYHCPTVMYALGGP